MTTPDAPSLSAIPEEAELYDRLLDAITTIRDSYPRLPSDAPSDEVVEAVMTVFADHLRVHLRARADELSGGAS